MQGWTAIIVLAIGFGLGLFLLNEGYEAVRNVFKEKDD